MKQIILTVTFSIIFIVFTLFQYSVYKRVEQTEKQKAYEYLIERVDANVRVLNEIFEPDDSTIYRIKDIIIGILENLDRESVLSFIEDVNGNQITKKHIDNSPILYEYYYANKEKIHSAGHEDVFYNGEELIYNIWNVPEKNPYYVIVYGLRDQTIMKAIDRKFIRQSIIISSGITSSLVLLLIWILFEKSKGW